MSTSKGRKYEYIVRDFCAALGLKARRRKLSGSDLKKPYDVKVYGAKWMPKDEATRKRLFPLFIEAKRRMSRGDTIVLEKDWLDKIGVRSIVVFAVGRHPGRPMRHYCVCLPLNIKVYTDFTEFARQSGLTKTGCMKMNKYMKLDEAQVEDRMVFLECMTRKYWIVPFDLWLKVNGYENKEEKDDDRIRGPVRETGPGPNEGDAGSPVEATGKDV